MLPFSQMQSQEIVPPTKLEVAPFAACVSTKESCVDPLGQNPDTAASDRILYVDDNPTCVVALGRFYQGSTTMHNILFGNDQVKVGVEEVQDIDACILLPTKEIQLVGKTLNTLLAWLPHLVQSFSEKVFPFCCVYYY